MVKHFLLLLIAIGTGTVRAAEPDFRAIGHKLVTDGGTSTCGTDDSTGLWVVAIGRMDVTDSEAKARAAAELEARKELASFFTVRIQGATESSYQESDAGIQEAFSQIAEAHPELDCAYNNAAQAKAQTRMMSDTIQTFIYCFTVICGLIAVANVFNTLTNSLILRRREFAVLKSIGMGDRTFRRMIAYECASYAVRGFVIGFVLSSVVAVLLGRAMGGSFVTFTMQMPWLQVALSAGIVLAVILVSVAYALHQCRASSVVEALRDDAI